MSLPDLFRIWPVTMSNNLIRQPNFGALVVLVWLVVALVTLPEQSRTWLRPYIAANVLIALLIARTLLENIYTVWRYRRERA